MRRAIKQHLSAKNLHVVIVAKDAEALRDQLLKDEASSIKYEAPKPKEIVEEDKIIRVQAQTAVRERADRRRESVFAK